MFGCHVGDDILTAGEPGGQAYIDEPLVFFGVGAVSSGKFRLCCLESSRTTISTTVSGRWTSWRDSHRIPTPTR